MDHLRRLTYTLWYFRRPPWDSGITPPEVVEYLASHPRTGPDGTGRRLLDLGCGTGTSSLAFARAGWTVTGVDFVPHALRKARRKARAAGLSVEFLHADVTRLPPFPAPFDLVLDIGCFHGLTDAGRQGYAARLESLLGTGGEWLMYAFLKRSAEPGPGLTETELARLARQFRLFWRQDGLERGRHPSTWVLLGKR